MSRSAWWSFMSNGSSKLPLVADSDDYAAAKTARPACEGRRDPGWSLCTKGGHV